MERYDRHFYETQRESGRRSARRVVPLVLELIHPASVVDVGCGVGTWLSVFREHGVEDFRGIDIEGVEGLLEIPLDQFLAHDLTRPIEPDRQFDLVVCLEVAEHLPPDAADTLIASLARLGPVVLFSAAIPHQGGTHHVNEQWPEYWAARFDAWGYEVLDAIRPRIWEDPDVEWWYAQNALLFVRRDRLLAFPKLVALPAVTSTSRLALVHPRKYLELIDQARRVEETRRELATLIPSGASFIFVDLCELESALPPARSAIPFLECDGQYWGPPADDGIAVDELERLRRAGAAFAVFAWPAFWWFEHYPRLSAHLKAYPRVLDNDRLVAFDLRVADPSPRSGDTSARDPGLGPDP
jgi:SAM-dependent methyltransferase